MQRRGKLLGQRRWQQIAVGTRDWSPSIEIKCRKDAVVLRRRDDVRFGADQRFEFDERSQLIHRVEMDAGRPQNVRARRFTTRTRVPSVPSNDAISVAASASGIAVT